ncbi:MAG: AAA family ATPase [Kofleriaceae bacterium]
MTCFGRGAELRRLLGLADDDPVAVLVGLPGIGKSELAYRVEAELLAAAPRPVVHVNVAPGQAQTLYRQLLAKIDATLDEPSRGAASSELALDALVERLVRSPHLVLLDDAHHAPLEAAALIDRLMRRISVAARLIVASRSMLPIETTPIVVRVEPLPPDAGHAMVEHFSARLGVQVEDVGAVVARGGGSPLLLRHLIAGSSPGERSRDPLHATITALDAPAQRALTQLAAVASCSQSRPAAARLVSTELILQTLHEQCLIDFGPERVVVHDLVRDAVLAKADPELVLSSRVHAARLLWNEYRAGCDPRVAIEAICLAASVGDLESAMSQLQSASRAITDAGLDHLILPKLEKLAARGSLDACLLAARIYVRVARVRDAARMLDHILPADRLSYQALIARAALAERRGELTEATRGFARALDSVPAGQARTWLRLRLVTAHALAGRCDEAAGALAELEPVIFAAPDDPESRRDLARYWWSHTLVTMARYEWELALASIDHGMRAASNAGDRELGFRFRLAGLLAASELGATQQARTWADEVARARGGEPAHERLSNLFLGVAHLAEGAVDEIVAHLRHAYDLHAADHDVLLSTVAAYHLARAMLVGGSAAAACEVLRGVVDVVVGQGLGALVGPAKALYGRALVAAGRLDEAHVLAAELVRYAHARMVGEGQALHAHIAAMSGDLSTARRHLALALEAVGDRVAARASLVMDQALLELFGGDPERARAAALAARDASASRAHPRLRGSVLYVLAVADLAAGLTDTALEALGEAEAIAAEYALGQLTESIKLLRNATALGDSIFDRVPQTHRQGYLGLLRVLGLRSGTLLVLSRRGRIHTGAAQLAQAAQHFDIVVDRVVNSLRGPSSTVEGRATAVAILVGLAESEEPVSPERLYQIVWGAGEYHPIRHRNTLYIALNRTRKALKDIGESREVILRGSDGWYLSPEIDLAVVYRDPRVSTVAVPM